MRKTDLFSKSPSDLISEAITLFHPIKIYVGFSGGNDSLALAQWMIENVPGSELFHIDTGIGVEKCRQFVKDTAAYYKWPLTIIRAKEDCGQDYDEIVRRFGFPGPRGHQLMYQRLKERGVELLVRRAKTKRSDRILLATGIRADESVRRMGYKGREINRKGAQVWVNPIYWWSKDERDKYITERQIRTNPVSQILGISGECLCGAFAHPGELEKVRSVDAEVADRIERLQIEISDRFPWGWEGRPPPKPVDNKIGGIGALCRGCEKSSVVQELLWP